MYRESSSAPREVQGDKTFEVLNIHAVAFSLRPVSGRGGFPVRVTVDGKESESFMVDSPDWTPQLSPFTRLRVDARPGGAVVKDAWEVKLAATHEDIPRTRLLRDTRGALVVSSPQEDLRLFDLNGVQAAGRALFMAMPEYAHPYVFIRPPLAGISVFTPTPVAWDARAFSRLIFTAEQPAASQRGGGGVRPCVFLSATSSPTTLELLATQKLSMGTTFDLAAAGGDVSGSIELGAPCAEVITANRTVTPRLSPYVFIALEVAGPLDPAIFTYTDSTNMGTMWRLAAVGY